MGDDRISSSRGQGPISREPRSSAPGGRGALARSVAQHRAFIELARVVAAGPQGLWTGALPVLLPPSGAAWGAVYRVAGNHLELSASEGLPFALRASIEAFDLSRHAGFAACRAVRTRRAAGEDKIFAAALDARAAAGFEAAGISSGTAVPIVHGGAVFGVLVAGGVGREALDGEALLFLDAAASLLAPALALADAGREPVRVEHRSPIPPRPPVSRAPHEEVSPPRVSSIPPRRASAPPPSPSADVGRAAVQAVQQCTPFLRRLGIDVRLAVEEGHVATGEASDIGFAIAHLLTNAAEAAADRTMSAGSPSPPRRVRVAVAREGAMILVSVDDSGRGVPPDLRARVFEPGFSTKGKSRGNGLTAVRKIALASGGHVEVGASELGGASFRLLLPASASRPEQTSSGTWRTGATWPSMHATGREPRDAGEGGGDGADGAPGAAPLRRASAG